VVNRRYLSCSLNDFAAPTALCEGALLIEIYGVAGSSAIVMAAAAHLDPVNSELEAFVASNLVWEDGTGTKNIMGMREGGLRYFKQLPFRMHLELRFRTVTINGEFRHLAAGAWRDVYHCSLQGLVVKILPSLYGRESRSEYEQRAILDGCVAPTYGHCYGDVSGTCVHLLVAAYVGPSFVSQIQNIIGTKATASGLLVITEQLKQASWFQLFWDRVILFPLSQLMLWYDASIFVCGSSHRCLGVVIGQGPVPERCLHLQFSAR
jgi:hypothetical protein